MHAAGDLLPAAGENTRERTTFGFLKVLSLPINCTHTRVRVNVLWLQTFLHLCLEKPHSCAIPHYRQGCVPVLWKQRGPVEARGGPWRSGWSVGQGEG